MISILIPTFNEQENVREICYAVINEMTTKLSEYNYEIVFIDNASTDETRNIISELCNENPKVKAIFNARNYGPINSPVYGLTQCTGDAVVFLPADFQEPPEMIESFVREWEKGIEVVVGQKKQSKTNPLMHFLRGCYYKTLNAMSDVVLLEQSDDFGVYDKEFISLLRKTNDMQPYLRGFVSKYAKSIKVLPYVQQERRAGKSKFNFYRYYDYAMCGFTSYTKVVMRVATFSGVGIALLSTIIGIVYLMLKLANWDSYSGATIPTLIGVFLLGGVQLFFIGILSEYILAINTRSILTPLVREEVRLNFDNNNSEI